MFFLRHYLTRAWYNWDSSTIIIQIPFNTIFELLPRDYTVPYPVPGVTQSQSLGLWSPLAPGVLKVTRASWNRLVTLSTLNTQFNLTFSCITLKNDQHTLKSCSESIERFLKYVWSLFNSMHEMGNCILWWKLIFKIYIVIYIKLDWSIFFPFCDFHLL